MSNIHGFHNIGPRASGPPAQAPMGSQRYARQSDVEAQSVEQEGISFSRPAPRPDNTSPELSDVLCPRIGWMRMTTYICLVDIVMFIITLIVGSAKFDGAFVGGGANPMGGPSVTTLCHMGGKWEPSIRVGNVWRLFTSMILHAGVLHIAGNLLMQMRLGFILEARWGQWRFLAVYILAGLMGSLWSTEISPNSVSVGASGALFGLVGSDATYIAYNWSQIPDVRFEAIFLLVITVVNFLLGMSGNIDNYAHLGGLIGGLFLGLAIPPNLVQREWGQMIRIGGWIGYIGLFVLFLLLIFVGQPYPVYSACP